MPAGNVIPPAGFGFSLIEVTIALSVAAFALLAILGLLQTGVASQKATIEQTAATSIATMIYSDLVATTASTTTSRFSINLSSSLSSPQTIYFDEAGKPTGAIGSPATPASRYRASIAISPPASGLKAPTGIRLLITWPAAADPNPGQWPTRQAGAVETWTALDRN